MSDESGGIEKAKTSTVPAWIAADRRRPAPIYEKSSFVDQGTDDLPKGRYLDRAFHEAEMAKMWSRVWQMACHESHIPEVGDHIEYSIGHMNFAIVRVSEDVIKAYRNACLHRGMQLVEGRGHAAALRCRFHGWTWNLDGTLRRVTESWDFPQVEPARACLPEAKVGRWGGFVFINPDPDAEPFERYRGSLDEHFASAPLENRRIAVHAARVMPANWKITMEAFLESYHVSPTHPQSVPIAEYAETQYDIYPDQPNMNRMITISVAQATTPLKSMSQQDFADYVARMTQREAVEVPDGMTFRQALAEQRRQEVAAAQGEPVDHLTDVEMLDAVEYFLFPNFVPWHGFGLPIVYRFRPNGDDHESSVMEIFLMAPRDLSQAAPAAPETLWIPPDSAFSAFPALGRLGPIFDQDLANISGIQRGLRSTAKAGVTLARYQEARIRHYHRRIDDFLHD